MKKFFVSLMALILGTTGYAVVDKTIETRVETLESQVSELQEDVSVLENQIVNLNNSSDEEKTEHELVGTKIEIPFDTYTYKRYGYVGSEFDAYAERVENELIIHSLKATIVGVYEYKTPDVIDSLEDLKEKPTQYKVRIECNYTTKVNGEYYYYIYDAGDNLPPRPRSDFNHFVLSFQTNGTDAYWLPKQMLLASNYTGTFAEEIITTSLTPIDGVSVEGFHEKIDSEIPIEFA